MRLRKYLSGVCVLLALTGCSDGNGDFANPPASDFIENYYKSRGITAATHGSPMEMALFSRRDVPQSLPDRSTRFHDSGVKLIVKHSKGYSTVEPLYPLNVRQKYSANGRGKAVPVSVRIDPPFSSGTSVMLARDSHRLFKTGEEYQFQGRFIAKSNRKAAIALAGEVLSKTHCRGGTVTPNSDMPELAQAYGRNARSASGLKIMAGWVVNFRCSRWRER